MLGNTAQDDVENEGNCSKNGGNEADSSGPQLPDSSMILEASYDCEYEGDECDCTCNGVEYKDDRERMLDGLDESGRINHSEQLFKLWGHGEAKLPLRTLTGLVHLEVQYLPRDRRAAPTEYAKFHCVADACEVRAMTCEARTHAHSGDNIKEPDAGRDGRAEGHEKQEEP